ncbi:alpha/beta fold hydrolase [Paludifilum halophilum]|uniref:AB hydrolase-1 domain-containing protein n=1 Tax=Paludifilum halophilum TaxID=1642702 RepID=A0A235B369_9BACL|nr:alpha/beta hydrolase [Paludifilum halophilum]OYD06758.1 hypothetical protein CHM34_14455 [Paludifilum halophilum]
MPRERVGDIQMYYEQKGQGPALIMIMGLGGNLDWWGDPFWNDLAQDYCAIAFDNRGAGRTERPQTAYSIVGFAEDTVRLMDRLGISTAYVMGFSMGGMIAQEIALRYPDRVDRLILGCTNCGGHEQIPADEQVRSLLMEGNGLTEEKKDNQIRLLFPNPFVDANPAFIEKNMKELARDPMDPASFRRQWQAIVDWEGSYERLPEVDAPTLVMHGNEDILIPPENANLLAERIPDAEVRLFEDAGHGLNAQCSHQVAEAVVSFLKK